MKKSFQKTAIDTLMNGGAHLLLIPLNFISLPILTKNLSIQEYGIWGLIFTTCSLMTPLTSLGLGPAMSRFLPGEKDKELIRDGFYSVLFIRLALSILIAGIFFLYAEPLSLKFFEGRTNIVFFTAIFIILSTWTPIYQRMLRILRKIKLITFMRIFEGYGKVVLFSVALFYQKGLLGIIYSSLIFQLLLVIFYSFYINLFLNFKLPSFSQLKKYLRFGLPLLPASIGFWIVNLTDRYIIVYFLGTGSVGAYSAAYTLGKIPYTFSYLINFIMLITLSKLYDEGRISEVKTHLSYALKYFLLLTIPFIFGSLILSDDIILALSTQEIALKSKHITPLVALSHLFLGIYTIVIYILVLTKKTKHTAFVWMIAMPLNLGLNIIFIPSYGLIAAAIATLVTYFICLLMISYFAFKELRFNLNLFFSIKSFFASILMSAVILHINSTTIIQLILSAILGVIIYFSSLAFLGGFSKKEYDFFKKTVTKLF